MAHFHNICWKSLYGFRGSPCHKFRKFHIYADQNFCQFTVRKITAKANFLRNLILAKLGECKYILKKSSFAPGRKQVSGIVLESFPLKSSYF